MSESTPIRTSKDYVREFEIQDSSNYKDDKFSSHNKTSDINQRASLQSYNDWRENLTEERDAILIESSSKGRSESRPDGISKTTRKSAKTSARNKSNIGTLTRISPQKLKTPANLPILSQSNSTKSPLTSRAKNGVRHSEKKHTLPLNKGYSVEARVNLHNQLTVNAELRDYNQIEKVPLTSQNSVLANYEYIREVDENKQEIAQKKQRLRDLEEEIVTISDKMMSYQNETDEIIADLQQRIKEREELNQRIKEEPMFYCSDSTQELKSQDEYTSSDELLFMLRYGVDKKFKTFLDSCKSDVKAWKEIAKKEVDAFNQLLQEKHRVLVEDLNDELSDFTPVLNGKFEIK
jgi:hypothetical protein